MSEEIWGENCIWHGRDGRFDDDANVLTDICIKSIHILIHTDCLLRTDNKLIEWKSRRPLFLSENLYMHA